MRTGSSPSSVNEYEHEYGYECPSKPSCAGGLSAGDHAGVGGGQARVCVCVSAFVLSYRVHAYAPVTILLS